MIFWLFSGWFQKPGAAVCSSVCWSLDFSAGASKIPPHSQGVFAEGGVLAFQIVERDHFSSILADWQGGADALVRTRPLGRAFYRLPAACWAGWLACMHGFH